MADFGPKWRGVVGNGSHKLEFQHPLVGTLVVKTGMDAISWGYSLNTARWPTYGGEVVQILSVYVDDLEVQGTFMNYPDLETFYAYFITYIQRASSEGPRNDQPMTFCYPHRHWEFKLIVTEAPGYRKARDVVALEWRLKAHVVDDQNDVESLKELIIEESAIKRAIGSTDPNFSERFGLQGMIRFTDENPFSDPWTGGDWEFTKTSSGIMDKITDYYSSLIPAWLEGDFQTIFGGLDPGSGSRPAFNPGRGPKGNVDQDAYSEKVADLADQIINSQKRDNPNGG